MTAEEFKAELKQTRFQEFVRVKWPANGALDEHCHPFEARALILAGEITLSIRRPRDTIHGRSDLSPAARYAAP